MKTVIHWKNTFKSFGLVVVAGTVLGVICGLLDIPPIVSTPLGIVTGMTTMIWCLSRWDCWHFE